MQTLLSSSVTSIVTVCLVVIGQVNLEHLFAPFYLTACVAGAIAAQILPHLPPLRFKKVEYVDSTKRGLNLESLPQDKTLFKYSIEVALKFYRVVYHLFTTHFGDITCHCCYGTLAPLNIGNILELSGHNQKLTFSHINA